MAGTSHSRRPTRGCSSHRTLHSQDSLLFFVLLSASVPLFVRGSPAVPGWLSLTCAGSRAGGTVRDGLSPPAVLLTQIRTKKAVRARQESHGRRLHPCKLPVIPRGSPTRSLEIEPLEQCSPSAWPLQGPLRLARRLTSRSNPGPVWRYRRQLPGHGHIFDLGHRSSWRGGPGARSRRVRDLQPASADRPTCDRLAAG
jgi:hypothetical protein